jgi:predicted transposase/invertase (TIGR01784 family)
MNNTIIHTPHDRFLRKMMHSKEVAQEFFNLHLPVNIKEKLNLDSIELQSDSFVDGKLHGQITDLLYSARFGERDGYLYILTEHQSTPEKLMPFRMMKYVVAIMERHLVQNNTDVLPVVVNMVAYTGAGPYNYSTDIFDLFGGDKEFAREILLKPFTLVDFSKLDEKELKPFLNNLFLVKIMRGVHVSGVFMVMEDLAPQLRELAELGKNEYISVGMRYIFEVCGAPPEQDVNDITKLLIDISSKTKCEANMITVADLLRRQGREDGMKEGIRKGMNEGMKEGERKAMKQVAVTLLRKHKSIDEIAELTGLPKKEIKEFTGA